MLTLLITALVLVLVVGPIVVLSLLHLSSGGDRRRKSRAQHFHDLALERQAAGLTPDPTTAAQRAALLDRLAARYPRDRPLPAERRALYELLTVDELAEAVEL